MEYPNFKVCVRCFTYNQSKYIVDTLNGFVIQQTNFPFVCCIVDDASNDGEQIIIREYLKDNFDFSENSCYYEKETEYASIIFAQHNININCYFAILFLKENHNKIKKSKRPYLAEWRDICQYEAICEGDDYWIVADKLQKQVSFLDYHPNFSVCSHSFFKLVNDELIKSERFSADFKYNIKEYLTLWPTQPLTTLIRISAYPSEDEIAKYQYFRDNHLYYLVLRKGSGFFMNDCMGVYRINNNGIWSSLSKRQATEIDALSYFELYSNYQDDKLLKLRCIRLYAFYHMLSFKERKEMKSLPIHLLGFDGRLLAGCLGLYYYLRYGILRK